MSASGTNTKVTGTHNDFLDVAGDFTLAGGTLRLFSYTGGGTDYGAPVRGDKWTIATATGTIDTGSYTLDSTAGALGTGLSFALSSVGSDVVLTVIPEPGTAGIVATFLAAALLRKRRFG